MSREVRLKLMKVPRRGEPRGGVSRVSNRGRGQREATVHETIYKDAGTWMSGEVRLKLMEVPKRGEANDVLVELVVEGVRQRYTNLYRKTTSALLRYKA